MAFLALHHFKAEFKKAIQQALPFILDATVDINSDKNHIVLRNTSTTAFYLPGNAKEKYNALPISEGVFGELKSIGLSVPTIEKLSLSYTPEAIEKATKITKKSLESGKLKTLRAFSLKHLQKNGNSVRGR